jgi:hypothetical protein
LGTKRFFFNHQCFALIDLFKKLGIRLTNLQGEEGNNTHGTSETGANDGSWESSTTGGGGTSSTRRCSGLGR